MKHVTITLTETEYKELQSYTDELNSDLPPNTLSLSSVASAIVVRRLNYLREFERRTLLNDLG